LGLIGVRFPCFGEVRLGDVDNEPPNNADNRADGDRPTKARIGRNPSHRDGTNGGSRSIEGAIDSEDAAADIAGD